MQPLRPRRAHAWPVLLFLSAAAVVELTGCASPGPPRPPSLDIPRLVSDLSAARTGDTVSLRFTVPVRTTDGQPLREGTVIGSLCRQTGSSGPCLPVDAAATHTPLVVPAHAPPAPVVWTDELPEPLRSGAPRGVAYRIELRNAAGRSAGFSDPVYAAGGVAPLPVRDLRAEGTRLGVKLQWTQEPGAGEVLLDRMEPVPAPARPAPVAVRSAKPGRNPKAPHSAGKAAHQPAGAPGLLVLQADPGSASAAATMDTSVEEGVPYRYTAVRRQIVQLGGHTLELRSASSAAVGITWRDLYTPPVPAGLTALGYIVPAADKTASHAVNGFAVDLVWQPVNDPRLAGYLVYRRQLNAAGEPAGARVRLTPEPVPTPGYHDASAQAGQAYRYSVTAIDPKGNESKAAETDNEPNTP